MEAAKVVGMEREGGRWSGRALFDRLGSRLARKAASSLLVWELYEVMVTR